VATTETCNTDGGTKTSRALLPPIRDRRRLLLVDDDDLIRDTMTEMLEGEGYDLLATASGADALRLLDAGEAVDLVLSDLSMPDMDGLTLIQETKRRRPGTPAILLTGHADDMAAAAADVGAAADFSLLRKPIALNQLTTVIESTLARWPSAGSPLRHE
jgi:CheY-like chemotaxis protein